MNRIVYTSNGTLCLVEHSKSDDRTLYKNWCDPETQRGYNGIYFDSFEEYEKRDSNRNRFFAMIQLKGTDEIIGAVSVSPPETVPDLAIWIFKPYRRQGYGTSAFMLAINYAVEEMGLTELHAGAYPDNIGSQKMLAKCGYVPYPEGNIPEKHYITGEDIIQMDYIWGGNSNMNSGVMNWWDNRSDEYYGGIQNGLDDIFDRADRAFPIVVWDMIRNAFLDLRGKRVLVPSSGDNIAVFGFHLLGASVTSCDISERQLYNAKKVADRFDWNIEFIRQDSMELTDIPNDTYDLVYTSNGVHVWIPDLPRMYGNFNRVLKPDGKYIMFETHPFGRPFDKSETEIKVKKPYTATGPFVSEVKTGTITEFGWRTMDLFNAVFDNGFSITHMEEFSPGKEEYDNYFYSHQKEAKEDEYKRHDWKINPWAALPQCIGFTAKKVGGK